LEIVFPAGAEGGPGEPGQRWDVEDALHEALARAGVGEVTGGGAGEHATVDGEGSDFAGGLPLIRRVLRGLAVPPGVRVSHNEGDFLAGSGKRTYYGVYE